MGFDLVIRAGKVIDPLSDRWEFDLVFVKRPISSLEAEIHANQAKWALGDWYEWNPWMEAAKCTNWRKVTLSRCSQSAEMSGSVG
jgi:hypothetical protein